MTNKMVQVGFTAQRTIDGEFLPAIPVYVYQEHIEASGLARAEEKVLHDISGLVFKKYKEKKLREEFENGTIKI